ncbi:MAG TPA: hypothetical protein VNK25_00530 [Candidatus Nitrosotenuis sp.]|nr:hypothetical protein [Candidatus Nitrosotenuis sp.]
MIAHLSEPFLGIGGQSLGDTIKYFDGVDESALGFKLDMTHQQQDGV